MACAPSVSAGVSFYALRIDFETFYDAIPLPGTRRNRFIFRSRRGDCRSWLRTLPACARWGVAVWARPSRGPRSVPTQRRLP
jgi:hypothetical protein